MKFKHAIVDAVKTLASDAFIKRIKEEDDTMLKHLTILKEINKYGFITNNSQTGNKTVKEPYEIKQRAYISGFMLETMAQHFIKNMGLYTDKGAIYIPICDTIPSNLDIPLTITKINGKIQTDTHMSSALPFSVWESYRKQLHINKNEKIVFIFCWDLKWCRNASGPSGLFTDVLKILKSIQNNEK
jgi:hypothetical protein